ncbi:MAG: BrnT family toxin [Candidatus Hydrogenedentes bacterium]|nr:BrnT family toxin [Candidatus Hydrogenedentota bacterium]
MRLEFEWDVAKEAANITKHGVSFEEAKTVFLDPFARVVDDEWHSTQERRELIFGYSIHNRLLTVCYTERNGDTVRIISARPIGKKERKRYVEFRES